MDCYKALNKELITEIQTMKAHISYYKKELNLVRRDMLQERTLRVEQEQQFLAILTKNFRHMVCSINPDVNLAHLLDMEVSCKKEENEQEKYKRLSNDKILENLRNSNELQNVRRSLIRMSPIAKRKSGECTSLQSPAETSAVTEESSLVEVEDEDDEQYDGNADIEPEEGSINDCAEEEEEQKEEEEEKDYENDAESDENEEQNEDEAEIEQLVNATEQLGILESIFEEEDESEESTTITKRISKESTLKRTNYSSPLRDITNCDELVFRTTPEDLDDSMISRLPSFETMNRSNLICSTPLSTETFDDVFNESRRTDVLTNDSNDLERTTRPRRNCRPNNLKETNLRKKLRNEGDSLRSNRRSKNKSKSIPSK